MNKPSAMPSKVFSYALDGLDARLIEIETDVSSGLRCFTMVGLPGKEVEEAKERIESALKSAGFYSPHSKSQRILVNLAPADIRKQGALYDLPIAIGYLLASSQIKFDPARLVFAGELALDGKLRPIKGALSFSLKAKKQGFEKIILPKQNAAEAGLVKGVKAIGVQDLADAIHYLRKELEITPFELRETVSSQKKNCPVDIDWIKGQEYAKRALEIAAAGRHNLLLTGPPGTGKTLLAKSICSIMPKLSFENSLEITQIYSAVGLLDEKRFLIDTPPFRAPHHSSSEVALLGGGNPPKPGEITLAHKGVLFLDEFPEFHRDVLESLRQPLEDGKITILRARHYATFPAKFTLIAAANPCPCGFYNDPEKQCSCAPSQIQKYRRKLSGPLMDRIDLFISVPALRYEELTQNQNNGKGEKMREEIKQAQQIQKTRFENEETNVNSEMTIPQMQKYCLISAASNSILKAAVNAGKLSPRGFHRVLKVARTIADLDKSTEILDFHINEALMYRLQKEG